MKIDLRSDTVTRPTEAMKAFMLECAVGDDVFEEDPTVNELERYGAELFGKEAAIFCPSGTMTNQIAIKLNTFAGAEVICHKESHVYNYEGGGIAANAHASVKLIDGDRGRIRAGQIEDAVNPEDIHKPITSLICLEDTSNRGGGCCYDPEEIKAIRALSQRLKLPMHCDGARVFNALVKRGDTAAEYGALFDTISICLSKGLGAPVGSLLLGTKQDIKRARRIRKVFGGGMRQAGIIAGAGLFALNNNVERLSEDHRRAQVIAKALENKSYVEAVYPVETNIVVFKLIDSENPVIFLQKLADNGVYAVSFGGQLIRFVTHLDFDDDQLEQLLAVLKK